MTTIIRAVYEGGVLRPTEPLALSDGESVEIFITQTTSPGPRLREPTLAEEDFIRRISEAKSLEEMFAVMDASPGASEDELDIVKAIDQSRRLTGFRMPDPGPAEENRS